MAPSNIRDILASFSPSLDLFAICIGDGRIKVWDTTKGQLQTEFSDITPTDETNRFGNPDGHLTIDYTCMKWISLDKKKKRKLGTSILVLGTRGGDVIAWDVSGGQLKWRINDCHPGGATAVSFHANTSHVYTAGADGVVCNIDLISGVLLNKFNATSKSISSLAISPDGKTIATAASQLRIFDCSNHKKLQKFSGHPEPVRCMVFSEDGSYVLSAASNERYIALWKVDGSNNRQVSTFLSMDHPAVFLDTKCTKAGDNSNLSVLALSEFGVGYFWHGRNIDDLRICKPAKIYVPWDDEALKKHKGAAPCVFFAKLQNVVEPASGHIFLAYGSLIKPTFGKAVARSAEDVTLTVSQDGILLPVSQAQKSKKGSRISSQVTALDHSNMEPGLLPVPRISSPVDERSAAMPVEHEDNREMYTAAFSVEERLTSLGILGSGNDRDGSMLELKDIDLDESTPHRKMKATVSSMESEEALSLLRFLVKAWHTRSYAAEHVLPWIHTIVVYHGDFINSQDPKLVGSLHKAAESRASAMKSLLKLSGRLQLVSAQVGRASSDAGFPVQKKDGGDNSEEEDEDDDVGEDVYGDEFETSSDEEDKSV